LRQLTRGIEWCMQVVHRPIARTYAFVAIGAIEEGRGGPAIYTIGDDGTRLTRVSQSATPDAAGGAHEAAVVLAAGDLANRQCR